MRRHDTEVLIVGAGPAGLTAARTAAGQGSRVLLVDDNPRPGGQIWRDGPNAELPAAAAQLRAAVKNSGVELMTGARVVGAPEARTLLLETAEATIRVSSRALILCTGARERLLPFPGWTLPGVTGAGGLQALIKAGYDVRGQRVVIAGSGPLLLATAHQAERMDAQVRLIAEQAPLHRLARFAGSLVRWPSKLRQSVRLAHHRYRWRTHVVEALGADRLEAVRLQNAAGRQWTVDCEFLGCGFGLVPNTELGELLGCRLETGAIAVDAQQATSLDGVFAAGECTGIGGMELAAAEGRIAGLQATGTDVDSAARAERDRWRRFADALEQTFKLDRRLKDLARPDTVICRCEDVTQQELAAEAGWKTAKMEHRCGMGACQGRICGPATEFLFDWRRTSQRLPVFPARVDTLACGLENAPEGN